MSFLRHNRCWPVWVLVLAMVFTIGGTPAYAAACSDALPAPGTPVAAAPARSGAAMPEVCPATGKLGPCCCTPAGKASNSRVATSDSANDELAASKCGCSVQAPAPSAPAELKAAMRRLVADSALLPRAAIALQLPTRTLWIDAAPSTGPPTAPALPSGPSRAPPAC